jgi:hypothetical protein
MTDWSEAQRVLEAIYEVSQQKPVDPHLSPAEVNEALGRETDDPTTARALYDLARTGYLVDVVWSDVSMAPQFFQLSERGLARTSAGWPSGEGSVEALLAVLAAKIDAAEDDEERTRLQRAFDALRSLGRETLSDILANIATGRL